MITMLAFILTDLIGNSTLLGGQAQNPDIAEIAGRTITNENFTRKFDELSYIHSLNTGRNPTQNESDQIRDQTWNVLILESAYQNQFDELGLVVTAQELVDLVQGNNISNEIKSFFADPQTGSFSKDNITNFLASLSQAPPQQQASWISLENSLKSGRLIDKYQNLFAKTTYVTRHEAMREYDNQNAGVSLTYLFVPYLTVNDTLVDVTDGELEEYIKENKEEYRREESRSIEYAAFDIRPSALDSALLAEEIVEIKNELANATDDSSYVSANSDNPNSFIVFRENELPDPLKYEEEIPPAGYVSEPQIVNGSYEFYKLSGIDETDPDSILYRVAKIRKDFFVSDETINEIYREADQFAASCGNAEEFQKNAAAQGLRVQKASGIGRNASRINTMNDARNIVRWMYNDAKKGVVSDVKEVENMYLVAVLTEIQEKGSASLGVVRNQVTAAVKNDKKGDMVIEKLDDIEGDDLSEITNQYGEDAKTGTTDVSLYSNSIASAGYAPEAIGLAFALEEGEITAPFKIKSGVIMIQVLAREPAPPGEDYSSLKQQVRQRRQGGRKIVADFPLSYFRIYVSSNIDKAIQKFANIEDMRYKFF